MEEYLTDAALSQLPVNAAYPDLLLRCAVLATVPLRTCEFSDEKVFTAVCSVAPLPLSNAASCTRPVRVNFYGAWGMAASFMDPGDVILLLGFCRLDAPLTSSPQSSVFVCPLPESEGGELRVLQPGRGGDVMEVLVSPSSMDAVSMRGLTASDRSNHLYMRQCRENTSTPS